MKVFILFLCAACAGMFAQQVEQPLASFTGTVREINSTNLRLARPDQDDLDISCTHNTHYFRGLAKDQARVRSGPATACLWRPSWTFI